MAALQTVFTKDESMRLQTCKWKSAAVFFSAAILGFAIHSWASPQSDKASSTSPQAATQTAQQDAKLPPLEIARQGYLFAGGKYSTVKNAKVMSGQIYAEFQIPARPEAPLPNRFHSRRGADRNQFHGHPRRTRGLGAIFPASRLRDLRGRSGRPRQERVSGQRLRPAGDPECRLRRASLHGD